MNRLLYSSEGALHSAKVPSVALTAPPSLAALACCPGREAPAQNKTNTRNAFNLFTENTGGMGIDQKMLK